MDIMYQSYDDKKEKFQSVEIYIKVPSMVSGDKEFSHKTDDVVYTFYTRNILEVDSIVTNFKHELSSWFNKHRSEFNMVEVKDINNCEDATPIKAEIMLDSISERYNPTFIKIPQGGYHE